MANTNAPTVSTVKSQRIPLVGEPTARNGTANKDRKLINYLPEFIGSSATGEKDIFVKKRPGVSAPIFSIPNGVSRGVYIWNEHYYSVVGNTLYVDSTATITLTTSTGKVGFTTFNGTSQEYLVVLDGVEGYVFTGVLSFTQITSPDFPTPHIPIPVSQDGYLIVADDYRIYNSNLGTPFLFTAGDYIEAEMYPDQMRALSQIKNYFIAFGKFSTEFFFNPGTIASGSPFQRNDSAVKQIGTTAPYSIANSEDQVVFVGTASTGGVSVYQLDGFNLKEIGDFTVKTSLEYITALPTKSIYGYILRVSGHRLYILQLRSADYNKTWVYDFAVSMWTEWKSGVLDYFQYSYGTFSDRYEPVLQHDTNGNLYLLSATIYKDIEVDIDCIVQTAKLDFGTANYKDHNRFTTICDLGDVTNSDIVPITCTLGWSDNDYSTWTYRNIPVNSRYCSTLKLGKARRRAYKHSMIGNTTWRLEAIELDLNVMGT